MIKNYIKDKLIELCSISSPSLKEGLIGENLFEELKRLGLEVKRDNAHLKYNGQSGNVIAYLKGKKEGTLLFSAHMDTVLPCEKVVPVVEGDILKSDGTSILGGDDKGGIVAILNMLKEIKEKKLDTPNIIVVFSICEEIGMYGAKELELDEKVDYAFVIDSSGKPGNVVVKAPYALRGTIEIVGKTAHAGIAPEEGINALVVASKCINSVKIGRIDKETTSNIGVVTGGEASNIVMGSVKLTFESRSFSKEKLEKYIEDLKGKFSNITNEYGALFKENLEYSYEGYEYSDKDEIVKLVKKSGEKIGLDIDLVSSGGGSDANILNEKGIKAINLACGMTKVHTLEEYIRFSHVEKVSELICEIIKEY